MGIQSTRDITREQAIDRILEIVDLIKIKNYRKLEEISYETDLNLQEFVENWIPIDSLNIHSWTNKMLEDYIDNPFFRYSLFDNYLIKETI